MTDNKHTHRYRDFLSISAVFIALLLIPTLSSCVDSDPPKKGTYESRAGGVVNYALSEPVAIDPAFAVDNAGFQVIKGVFDGLVDYDPKTLKARPAVAKDWRSSSDGREWTFNLDKDVKFHNGQKLTADDFVYAWDRAAAKKTGSEAAYHFEPIEGYNEVKRGKKSHLKGVSAVGKHVLKVKLKYPFTDFPSILGHPVFSPVPKEEVKAAPKHFADQPIGNGPFAMDGAWAHNKSINIKKFDDYYGRPAYLDGVHFRILDKDQTAFLQFQGGGLDIAPIPNGQINPTVKQFGSDAMVGQPRLSLEMYGFNLKRAPFKGNEKLRQAINYAIDRPAIVKDVYENSFVAAGSLVPPSIEDYEVPRDKFNYSLKTAKRLLSESGYPNGKGLKTIKLSYAVGRGHEAPAQIVQQNLADIGVDVRLEGMEFKALRDAISRDKLAMFAITWEADYPTPDAFLYQLFYSRSGDNVFGFSHRRVDGLLLKARRSSDEGNSLKSYEEAEADILEEAPVAPYAFSGTNIVHAKKIKGFQRTALGYTPLDRVWISRD